VQNLLISTVTSDYPKLAVQNKRTFLDYTLSAKAAPFRGICLRPEQRGYAMKTAAFCHFFSRDRYSLPEPAAIPFLLCTSGGVPPRFIRRAEYTEPASDARTYFRCSSYRRPPRHSSLTVLSGSRKKACVTCAEDSPPRFRFYFALRGCTPSLHSESGVYGSPVRPEILLRVLLGPQHSSSLLHHCSEWQSKKGRALRALGYAPRYRDAAELCSCCGRHPDPVSQPGYLRLRLA
jgi:hypothetical protein